MYVNALDRPHRKALSERDLRLPSFQKLLPSLLHFHWWSQFHMTIQIKKFQKYFNISKETRVSNKSFIHNCASYRSLRVLLTESNMWLAGPASSIHVHLWLFCVSGSRWWSTVILLWILTFPSSEPILEGRQKCSHGPFLLEPVPHVFYQELQLLLSAPMSAQGSLLLFLLPIQKEGVYSTYRTGYILSWHLD